MLTLQSWLCTQLAATLSRQRHCWSRDYFQQLLTRFYSSGDGAIVEWLDVCRQPQVQSHGGAAAHAFSSGSPHNCSRPPQNHAPGSNAHHMLYQQSSTIFAFRQQHLVTGIVTNNITAAAASREGLQSCAKGQHRTQQAFICITQWPEPHHAQILQQQFHSDQHHTFTSSSCLALTQGCLSTDTL